MIVMVSIRMAGPPASTVSKFARVHVSGAYEDEHSRYSDCDQHDAGYSLSLPGTGLSVQDVLIPCSHSLPTSRSY